MYNPSVDMTPVLLPVLEVDTLYQRFDAPVVDRDCGLMCAPHNPSGKPFCCDICHAVPAAYRQEWEYLQSRTDLWHVWRGDECTGEHENPEELRRDTPQHMLLLACLGPARCQRQHRAVSCRQFPFFPYIASDYRFLGLACEWTFAETCWVISNLLLVTAQYRAEFVRVYDDLFARWQADLDSYYLHSEKMRIQFGVIKRRIPLLHRNGGYYLVSPGSERMQRVAPERLPRFGSYKVQND
jgi:hypothetical protein